MASSAPPAGPANSGGGEQSQSHSASNSSLNPGLNFDSEQNRYGSKLFKTFFCKYAYAVLFGILQFISSRTTARYKQQHYRKG